MKLFKRNKIPTNLNKKGFSLIEIMMVLGVIGAIMALILPRIQEGRDNSAVKNTKIKLAEVENKINEYQADCGKLPSSLDFMITDVAECKNWTSNKNAKNLMKDEWQTDLVFEAAGDSFNVKSLGKDKKEGGSGPDKDIFSANSKANEE